MRKPDDQAMTREGSDAEGMATPVSNLFGSLAAAMGGQATAGHEGAITGAISPIGPSDQIPTFGEPINVTGTRIKPQEKDESAPVLQEDDPQPADKVKKTSPPFSRYGYDRD